MTTRKHHNPSALMSAYNAIKNQGKRSALWDGPRADRALGYLMDGQAPDSWAQYTTTAESCECPDSTYRQQTCKHSLALLIDQEHDKLMADFLQTANGPFPSDRCVNCGGYYDPQFAVGDPDAGCSCKGDYRPRGW